MTIDVAIIGSGFGGLGAAVALRRAGVEDLVILERARDLGGTWRDNAYPGCRCDVASDLYSFSFAPNPEWTDTYSHQPEIWAYLRRVAHTYDLERLIRYSHEVTDVSFDEAAGLWRLTTSRGPIEARCVVLATGGLAEPRLPDIEGLASFAGPLMHTAAWDESVELAGHRVGVIGTGASAIQVVPQIAPRVAHLDVFQRTPPWVLPHLGHPVRERTRRLFRTLPLAQRLSRWTGYWRRELLVLGFVKDPSRMKKGEDMARQFLEAAVPDAALRATLTPTYRMGCKRVLISNDYYPALSRDNVDLITSPITRVEPDGVRTADGSFHALDALVVATGFHVTDNPTAQRVHGVGGHSLAEAFRGDMATYMGTTFSGFPNLVMLGGPNTALGHSSIIFMIESQLRYGVGLIRAALSRGVLIEPTARAASEWTSRVRQKLPSTVWGSGCESWYLNAAGVNTTIWPDFTFRFRHATRRYDPARHRVTPARTGATSSP